LIVVDPSLLISQRATKAQRKYDFADVSGHLLQNTGGDRVRVQKRMCAYTLHNRSGRGGGGEERGGVVLFI
jgi:hypothetical protein